LVPLHFLAFVLLFLVAWLLLGRPEEALAVWRDSFAPLLQPIEVHSKCLAEEPSDDRY
jgi:hypothetical protein